MGQRLMSVMAERRRSTVSDLDAIVETLAEAVTAKDGETGAHLYRSAFLANSCLAAVSSVPVDPDASRGFLLHDVGKIGIPDQILLKPAGLDPSEWRVMRRHPEMGVYIVEPFGFRPRTTEVIAFHHERWDGRGYPYGLAGTEIPLAARIFAVADSYDAMTSDRPYRVRMARDEALAVLRRDAGSRYAPDAVEAFVNIAV